jgi:hypothetical protein
MDKVFKFYKESSGRWFIDLPEWYGNPDDLEMVLGADTFLDILSQGNNEIKLRLSDKYFNGSEKLYLVELGLDGNVLYGGGTYLIEEYKGIEYHFKLWLCDVTKHLFYNMPSIIYFFCLTET